MGGDKLLLLFFGTLNNENIILDFYKNSNSKKIELL